MKKRVMKAIDDVMDGATVIVLNGKEHRSHAGFIDSPWGYSHDRAERDSGYAKQYTPIYNIVRSRELLITDQDFLDLITHIQDNNLLTSLDLSHNDISSRFIKPLAKAIRIMRSLTLIDLSYNAIEDEELEILADSIRLSTSLMEINLDHNRLTSKGEGILLQAKNSNPLFAVDIKPSIVLNRIKFLLFSDVERPNLFNLLLVGKDINIKQYLPENVLSIVEGYLGIREIATIAARWIQISKNNQLQKEEHLVSGVKGLRGLQKIKEVKQQSIQEAEKQGVIGPREIVEFDLEDVEDDGNCFYYAVANQMKIIEHNFIQNVPVGTDVGNSLRLAVQGANFRDREWADDSTFDLFVAEFSDVILAIVDTRNPNAGFTLYYMSDDGIVITNTGENHSLTIPQGKMIIRIAATGNHFLSVRAHPSLEKGAITQEWKQDMNRGLVEDIIPSVEESDIVIKAVFEIRYDNPILNYPNFVEIFKLAKEKGKTVAITELMQLQTFEVLELSKMETAEGIVDKIIEQNFFLNNEKGRDFIQIIANNFDQQTLLTILELGRDQDIAEQILYEIETQGIDKVIYTLLGKEQPITGTTNDLENIISQDELNQLRLVPNGILNSWSNKVYKKVADYIDSLAKTLDDALNLGKSGSQIAVTLVLLEELLGFAASGQRFIGGKPPYNNPDDNDEWSYGGDGSSDGSNNSSVNFDNQHGFVGLILPLHNGTDYNITDHQI